MIVNPRSSPTRRRPESHADVDLASRAIVPTTVTTSPGRGVLLPVAAATGVCVRDYAPSGVLDLKLVAKEQSMQFPIVHPVVQSVIIDVGSGPLLGRFTIRDIQGAKNTSSQIVGGPSYPQDPSSMDGGAIWGPAEEVRFTVAHAEDSHVRPSSTAFEVLDFDESYFFVPPFIHPNGLVSLMPGGRQGTTCITYRVTDLAGPVTTLPNDAAVGGFNAATFHACSAIATLTIKVGTVAPAAALKAHALHSGNVHHVASPTNAMGPSMTSGTSPQLVNSVGKPRIRAALRGVEPAVTPDAVDPSPGVHPGPEALGLTRDAIITRLREQTLKPLPISLFRQRPRLLHLRCLVDASLLELPLLFLKRGTWTAEWRMIAPPPALAKDAASRGPALVREATQLLATMPSAFDLKVNVDSLLQRMDVVRRDLLSCMAGGYTTSGDGSGMQDEVVEVAPLAAELALVRARVLATSLGVAIDAPLDIGLALRLVSVRCDAVNRLIRAFVEAAHQFKHMGDLRGAMVLYRRADELAHVVQKAGINKLSTLVPFSLACGDCAMTMGDVRVAADFYEKARAYAEISLSEATTGASSSSAAATLGTSSSPAVLLVAECEDSVAVALSKLGQHAQALTALQRSAQMRQQYAAQRPSAPMSIVALVEGWLYQAWCHAAKLSFHQSEALLKKAVDTLEEQANRLSTVADGNAAGSAETDATLSTLCTAYLIHTCVGMFGGASTPDDVTRNALAALRTNQLRHGSAPRVAASSSPASPMANQQLAMAASAGSGQLVLDDALCGWIASIALQGLPNSAAGGADDACLHQMDFLADEMSAHFGPFHVLLNLVRLSQALLLVPRMAMPGVSQAEGRTIISSLTKRSSQGTKQCYAANSFMTLLACEIDAKVHIALDLLDDALVSTTAVFEIIAAYGALRRGANGPATSIPVLLDLATMNRLSALLAHVVTRANAVGASALVTPEMVAPVTEWFLVVASEQEGPFSPSIVPLLLDSAETQFIVGRLSSALELFSKTLRITDSKNLIYLLGPLCVPACRLTTVSVRERARLAADRNPGSGTLTAIALLLYQIAMVYEAGDQPTAAFEHLERSVAVLEVGDLLHHIASVSIYAACSRVALKLTDRDGRCDAHIYAELALDAFASHHYRHGLYKGQRLQTTVFHNAEATYRTVREVATVLREPLFALQPASNPELATPPTYA